jgi:hypothetical protein
MHNLNIGNLWHMEYWFKQPDVAFGWTMWALVFSFLALFLFGLIAKIWRTYQGDKFNKEILRRLGNLGLTMGLLGLLWMFFRQEHVLLLAWRIWLLVLAMIFFWWLSKILRYFLKRVPELRAAEAGKEMREKYLPGKN